jgi:iron complex outermembrane recepter protein
MRNFPGAACSARIPVTTSFCIAALLSTSALAQNVATSTAAQERSSQGAGLEEIIVTAQKRSERLLDVPVPVTAITAETLAERNQVQLEDYFRQVPGLDLTDNGGGSKSITLRGVTTGGLTNPTFAVAIDGIPYGSSSGLGYGDRLVPDLDPSNLARVEVLRGPQGTLYGASSLGGMLQYVTKDPSLADVEGQASVDFNSVEDGGYGHGARASISVPIIQDSLGISVSAFKRKDAGFIDDPARKRSDVDGRDIKGGLLAAMWKPSERFSLKLSALAQDGDSEAATSVDADFRLQPTVGDLAQIRPPGTGWSEEKIRFFTAVANAKLGSLDLTSLTGYGINAFSNALDFPSPLWGSLAEAFFGVSGTKLVTHMKTKKFSQELRVASARGEKIEWMLGAFYTQEKTPAIQFMDAFEAVGGADAASLIAFDFPTRFEEYAAFGNLTVNFTDQFDVQFGARQSRNEQIYTETDTGPVVPLLYGLPGEVFVVPTQHVSDSAFTYLVTPRFKFSPDLMVYSRMASGYRAGGNNPLAPLFGLPPAFDPDTTTNYELGLKGSLLDRTLTFDASVYYIDWKDVQLSQRDPASSIAFFTNGGRARSQGIELSLQSNPFSGLNIGITMAYSDAVLRKDIPEASGIGHSGDRLPSSARVSASLSADQEFPIGDKSSAFVGMSMAYSGERLGLFATRLAPPEGSPPGTVGEPGIRSRFPSYTTVDLRAGIKYDTWTFGVFARNAGNERGMLYGEPRPGGEASMTSDYNYTVIRPRAYGVSVSTSF